jgi:hypothetical protein
LSVSQQPEPSRPTQPPATRQEAVAVISAYGAFRLLVILLAVWSFIEGFALFTGSFDALTLGGKDRTAEQIIGAQMMVLVPVYGLLVWQRDRYRLLIWVPYVAQLAIILPLTWAVLRGHTDGILLLFVSLVFFILLFYFWYQSHPLEFFREEEELEEEPSAEEGDADAQDDEPGGEDSALRRRYRRKPGK